MAASVPELLLQCSDAENGQAVDSRARRPLKQCANAGTPILLLAMAMVAATLTWTARQSNGLHSDAEAITSATGLDAVPKFEKCGGKDFGEEKPCEEGCACIPKQEYFYQCMPPSHGGKCSVKEAKEKYNDIKAKNGHIVEHGKAIKERKKEAVKAKNKAAKELEDAKNHVATLAKKAKELASEKKMTAGVAEEQARKAKKAKQEHTVAEKRAKEAVAEAERKKPLHEEWSNAINPDKTSVDGAKHWKPCAGTDHEPKPCQPGCACMFKDKYFSECEPPKKSVTCDVSGAKKMAAKADGMYKQAVTKRDHLSELAQAAQEKFQKEHRVSHDASSKAAKTRSDLTQATDKLTQARKVLAQAEKHATSTAQDAKKAIAAEKKLGPKVKKAANVLNRWKQAAGLSD